MLLTVVTEETVCGEKHPERSGVVCQEVGSHNGHTWILRDERYGHVIDTEFWGYTQPPLRGSAHLTKAQRQERETKHLAGLAQSLLEVQRDLDGALAKQEGMERAAEAVGPLWRQQALNIVKRCAQTYLEFTSDQVWEMGLSRPANGGLALGTIMLEAARRGLIEKTDRTVVSIQPLNHKRPVGVWKSLVHRPDSADPVLG